MKRFLMILAAVMFVAVGCDNSKEQYDPDKNKPEVDNNGDNGGNGGNNGDNGGDGGTEENAAPWSALADSCTTVLIDNFLNKDT